MSCLFFHSKCIHAAMTRNAVWAATATALNRVLPAASPVAGRRKDATEIPCAALETAAVTVRVNSFTNSHDKMYSLMNSIKKSIIFKFKLFFWLLKIKEEESEKKVYNSSQLDERIAPADVWGFTPRPLNYPVYWEIHFGSTAVIKMFPS